MIQQSSYLILKAVEFMIAAHGDQKRKYTGEPYANHPLEVARIVASRGYPDAVVIAALFHDVIEDTKVTKEDIEREFGMEVANLVWEVTDQSKPSDGNRAARKKIDLEHLSASSPAGATIKLADLISNSSDIVAHDPHFAVVYLKEKAELLKVLQHGDKVLYAQASEQVGG